MLQLLEAEVLARQDDASVPAAPGALMGAVPVTRDFWEALSGVERPQLAQLFSCTYLEHGEDIVIAGPIGTGKTHLAISLGTLYRL